MFYHNEDREMLRQGAISHHIFEYLFTDGKKHTCLYWSSGFCREGCPSQPTDQAAEQTVGQLGDYVQKGVQRGLMGVIVDITVQSKTISSLCRELQNVFSEKKKLEEKSTRDALTDVYNQCFFDGFLVGQVDLATQNLTAFSCIMLDVVHFKNVNDTFRRRGA